jgi:hypothetical protein
MHACARAYAANTACPGKRARDIRGGTIWSALRVSHRLLLLLCLFVLRDGARRGDEVTP